ncbi:MAG: M23 family metallopeptidase [Mycobacterium sp.]|nr:MAG: M23 family metallopeptidase [Mycobacterium sp.]
MVLLVVALLGAAPTRADGVRMDWPLRPRPAVLRAFDAPSPDWNPGHRGVDLAGAPGQPVYAAGAGTVVFAATLAGRPVVSIAHPGGLRTSYEPVRASVRVGQPVGAGTMVGELAAGHQGCPTAACLHWGAMWGPASRADYVDPLGLLKSTPVRLKPLGSVVRSPVSSVTGQRRGLAAIADQKSPMTASARWVVATSVTAAATPYTTP